ncbi:hypothetical protein [Methanolobus psychrotolerans]|uniref:hypothetical protein n=1 Tax=Methanolobus psychrotolerans TaxID=1874706 RepID=UPI000B9158A7|nr:hypothetical protein [Methanolobus psychrotolerans]
MTFIPVSRRCHECNKLVHVVARDQKEVTCTCGAKYKVFREGRYLEKISSGAEIEERSPWEKFETNHDSNQNE